MTKCTADSTGSAGKRFKGPTTYDLFTNDYTDKQLRRKIATRLSAAEFRQRTKQEAAYLRARVGK